MCCALDVFFIFFFKQKTAYEMRISDWSSDVCSSDLSPMPRFWAMKRLRLFVSTDQARLWAPPGVEGSCHILSSSCRTTVPSPSIRPWQVDPAQEATPRKRPPPSPCERAGEELGRASCRERVCQYV